MNELLTAAQMYLADKLTIDGGIASERQLIENAGKSVAGRIINNWPEAKMACMVCGPGNNGADGFATAWHLNKADIDVHVFTTVDPTQLKGECAWFARRWFEIHPEQRNIVKTSELIEVCQKADILIDAMYGAGLSRPIAGEIEKEFIKIANFSDKIRVAIDIPSGIDGTSGRIVAVEIDSDFSVMSADWTFTFFRKKTGHVLYPGRGLSGRIDIGQIGISEDVLDKIECKTLENEMSPEAAQLITIPSYSNVHKYHHGHCLVVSGGMSSTGAARLAARAALRTGAGLVTVASPASAMLVNATHLTAIMLKQVEDAQALEAVLKDHRFNSIVVGPGNGVGENTREMVKAALTINGSVVLDADALTSFEDKPEYLFELIANSSATVVLTPHHGEFKRLFANLLGIEADDKRSKIDLAIEASRLSGAIIVYKGPDTVIAAPSGHAKVNTNAPPWLATAGSGDVLAGMIAGLAARFGMRMDIVSLAVWLHGSAGNTLGQGLIAEDLPEVLPKNFEDLSRYNENIK